MPSRLSCGIVVLMDCTDEHWFGDLCVAIEVLGRGAVVAPEHILATVDRCDQSHANAKRSLFIALRDHLVRVGQVEIEPTVKGDCKGFFASAQRQQGVGQMAQPTVSACIASSSSSRNVTVCSASAMSGNSPNAVATAL